MAANYSFPIIPFTIPTEVNLQYPPGRRQDGIRHYPGIPLGNLARETVQQLLDDFNKAVLSEWAKQCVAVRPNSYATELEPDPVAPVRRILSDSF